MSKRGFTLVELLGVLVILSVIMVLVFPTVSSILSQSRKTVNDVEEAKILNAAYDYTLNNPSLLPNVGEIKYIMLSHLEKERLIDYNIKDALTNERYSENLVISIKNIKNEYNPKSKSNSMSKGNYLYSIEKEFMNSSDFETKKPTIKFEGYDVSPIVININVGESYTPLTYTAMSNADTNITNSVVENIIYNSDFVDEVDTYSAGIYYINYSVIDRNGYSIVETVNLIVVDNEKPELFGTENVSINSSDTSFDLMSGVSCKDNSGKCDIKIEGIIEFGVVGKYIIEYKAYDPTGNTNIIKRVITVK